MNNINTGGPAFPSGLVENADDEVDALHKGMTLREYAAIKLRVPDSGTDWLDEMILKSLKNDFAAKAMQAWISRGDDSGENGIAKWAYEMADAMLKAREAV